MKFRFHGGGLKEAMEKVAKIRSKAHLLSVINANMFLPRLLSTNDITIKYYCYDRRIDWDTYLVTCEYGVIGYLDGDFK